MWHILMGFAPSVPLNGKEHFQSEIFYPLIDTFAVNLKGWMELNNEIDELFEFLSQLTTWNSEEMQHNWKEFALFYNKNINAEVLSMESLCLREYLKRIHTYANENKTIYLYIHFIQYGY